MTYWASVDGLSSPRPVDGINSRMLASVETLAPTICRIQRGMRTLFRGSAPDSLLRRDIVKVFPLSLPRGNSRQPSLESRSVIQIEKVEKIEDQSQKPLQWLQQWHLEKQ